MADRRLFVDTSFVLALIDRRDKYHSHAQALASIMRGRPLLVTDGILLEIGNALARSFRQEAVGIINSFLTSPEVDVTRLTTRRFKAAFALYQQFGDKEWTLVDCVSFVAMREAGVRQAVAFDHHFEQAGFQLLTVEPSSQ